MTIRKTIATLAFASAAAGAAPPLPPETAEFTLSDLEQQHEDQARQNREAQTRWSEWQARMKADFAQATRLNASPELVIEAMSRFLKAYAADNPFSNEDERLRGMAQRWRELARNGPIDDTVDIELSHLEYERAPSVTYPSLSLRLRETGDVLVEVLVDMDGAVVSANVLRSSGYPRLDNSAREAARGARFKPPRLLMPGQRARTAVPFSYKFDG